MLLTTNHNPADMASCAPVVQGEHLGVVVGQPGPDAARRCSRAPRHGGAVPRWSVLDVSLDNRDRELLQFDVWVVPLEELLGCR